jgi:hypothetical protein
LLHIIKGNKLAIVDEGKHLRSVAALKVDRLVVGAVDMHYLAWIEADPNTRRCGHAGVGVRFVIDHGIDSAMAVVWLIERYDALVAKRRQNWLMRPNRPQVLYKFIGSCRETDGSEGDENTRRGDPQAPPSLESVHCRSPSKHRLKTILSLKRVSLISAKSAVAFATIQSRATQIESWLPRRRGPAPQCRA